MSRVAKNPIALPAGVEFKVDNGEIEVKGPLGVLKMKQNPHVTVECKDNVIQCKGSSQSMQANALSGTVRALLANMVQGVTKGFERKLNLVGVGYRAQLQGDTIDIAVGYSHHILHKMPLGTKAEVPTPTEIIIKGIDKQAVGQVAAEIRAYRKPEPYKGKGIRYANEVIVLKETKKK